MKRVLGILLVLVSAALAGRADDKKDNATQEELKKFAGTWELVSLEVDGKVFPAADVKDIKVVVKGDKANFSLGSMGDAATTFSVDPAKKPKTMDSIWTMGPKKGMKTLSLYEVEGDNLKICSTEGEQRPKEFTAKEGSKCRLAVWKRLKN
jgi:uncharacterized protein (TIGR03067 family)